MTWLLAVVVGMLSLAGTGLHAILGIHHGSHHSVPANQAYRDSGSRDSTGGSKVVGNRLVTAGDEACDEAGCPICNFLAQGRIIGERFEGLSVSVGLPTRSSTIS